MSKQKPTPRFRNWYFGRYICAYCTAAIGKVNEHHEHWPEDTIIKRYLFRPFIDESNDIVLTPSGIHKFHEECWNKIKVKQ